MYSSIQSTQIVSWNVDRMGKCCQDIEVIHVLLSFMAHLSTEKTVSLFSQTDLLSILVISDPCYANLSI